MRAGDSLEWKKGLSWWRSALLYVSDFADVTSWGLGRWVKPGWDEPLPDVLVIDRAFMNKYRGLPFLYEWRLSALDIASLGSMAAIRQGSMIAFKRALVLFRDLGISFGGSWAISESPLGVSRKEDEVLTPYDPKPSSIYYLSLRRIMEQGYTSYSTSGDKYVFYR